MEIIRRITIENYEEARLYIVRSINEGVTENDKAFLCDPDNLKRIISHFEKEN
jgi:hypothetical protein